jgi:hypothetical protein
MGFGDGGFSLGGINFGGDGGVSSSTLRHRGRQVIQDILEPADREHFGLAERTLSQIPGQVRSGYKLARRNLGGAFRSAAVSAVERGEADRADALDRLTNSGYSGAGAIAANMRLGVGYNTSRIIADLQDRIGQIGADLDIGETEALARADTVLGDFRFRRGLAERERNMLHYQLNVGTQDQPSPYAPTDLSSAVMSIAGLFL